MNHTKNIAIVAMLAIAAVLIGTVGVSMSIQQQRAAAQNANATDIENSETNFVFKQKLKNNCSGFTLCTNLGTETFTPTLPGAGGG
jgi:hypothetical protein